MQVEPDFVNKHFIPVALDTYFRGNSHELAYCKRIRAGGNHLVVATAGGRVLGGKSRLRLRSMELAGVLAEYRALPTSDRKVELEDPSTATPPKRPVPAPPVDGLIIRGYCTYLALQDGKLDRRPQYYYKENPDRWAAETQSDMLWLKASEWKSLIPKNLRPGSRVDVPAAIQRRFYSTIGIDYMEGSVNSLKTRETSLALTVHRVSDDEIELRVEGFGRMGKPREESSRTESHSRGCEIRIAGRARYDAQKKRFSRFDLVGVGRAWGNKMQYTRREIRLDEYPWTYGIACELVRPDSPRDRIPPYNLLHYGSAGPYFAGE